MITLIDLLLLLIFNAFCINGFLLASHYELRTDSPTRIKDSQAKYSDIESKNFLWFISFPARKYLGWYAKPVATCPPCMASLHSTYCYFLFVGFPHSILEVIQYGCYILALSYVSYVMNKIID